jgi:hypothetical protein
LVVSVRGLRFKVKDSRFKIQDSKFKIQGSRFKVQSSMVQGLRFNGSRFRIPDLMGVRYGV